MGQQAEEEKERRRAERELNGVPPEDTASEDGAIMGEGPNDRLRTPRRHEDQGAGVKDLINMPNLPGEGENPGVPGAGAFAQPLGEHQKQGKQNPYGGFGPGDWNLVVEIATCTAESMKEKCNVPMLPHHTQM